MYSLRDNIKLRNRAYILLGLHIPKKYVMIMQCYSGHPSLCANIVNIRFSHRMDKNLNSTGRQTVKPNIRNNYNANMMTLFVVVVS